MSVSHLLLRAVLGRRLPVTAGELRVQGVSAPITIRRDKFGVPHIDAASDVDAAFAVGFCQGQDRGGQLEILLRSAGGRLCEWVGPLALKADRISRRIGFRRAAELQVAALHPHVRAQLEAFAAGVTAGMTTGLSSKPHEFAILGGDPTPWQVADVLALLKLQSFSLPSNWDVELARLRIALADGPAALEALDPVGAVSQLSLTEFDQADGHTATLVRDRAAASAALEALVSDLSALQEYLPRGGGSNNWVIAGSRTQSGKPIVASDPHLAPNAPPPWYLSHVRTPEWEAVGASLVGTPGYAIGHNGFAAWGVTAGLTDNTDLFVETLGSDRTSVRAADGSHTACPRVREVIRVKGQADVVEDVLVTPRGPVISSAIENMPLALSLRAVWLDPLPIKGFLAVQRSRSFEEFRSHFDEWPLMPLNIVYGDESGETAYFLIGQLPTRTGGAGVTPRPADRPDSGWSGLKPFEEMPLVRNPQQGWWATANNDPLAAMGKAETPAGSWAAPEMNGEAPHTAAADGSDWLGVDYCDIYRVQAIREALAARDAGWNLEDCLQLQCDLRCIPWEEMRPVVLSLMPAEGDARQALELLRDWNGRLDADSPAAAVFELFISEMCTRVTRAKAPNSWRAALGEMGLWDGNLTLFADRRTQHLVRLIREQPDGWFDSWNNQMLDVLGDVVRRLRHTVGPGPAYWGWGHLRQLRLDHLLFGKHRWLGPAFNLGPMPVGGDCNTISQAGARPGNPTDYTHNMCNLRTVFDLSDLSKSRFALCGGQSGNPCSPHFADQLPLWQESEATTIPWTQQDVIREAKQTLRLLPESRSESAVER
jgi:penicillin amidase